MAKIIKFSGGSTSSIYTVPSGKCAKVILSKVKGSNNRNTLYVGGAGFNLVSNYPESGHYFNNNEYGECFSSSSAELFVRSVSGFTFVQKEFYLVAGEKIRFSSSGASVVGVAFEEDTQ